MTTEFRCCDETLRLITRAISKAVRDRLPLCYQENTYETNNYRAHIKGDLINQCLREMLVLNGVTLHPFKRHGWEGRLIIDHAHKAIFNVVSKDTLDRIPKAHRKWPHYLQTLLTVVNGAYEPRVEQLSFMPNMEMFDSDTYNADFDLLLQGIIDDPQQWHHYVIAHTSSRCDVKDVHAYFLDGNFNVIDDRSLNEFIEPDTSALIAKIQQASTNQAKQDAHDLVGLKPGIKPPVIEAEDEA